MKTTKISLSLAVLMVAGALAFSSCKKKEKTTPQDPDNEQTSASDNALAENTSNDVLSMGSQVSENNSLSTFRTANADDIMLASCATISSNAVGTVVATQYTIDFGPTATCTCNDGRVRTGKIFFDFTGSQNGAKHYRNPGFKMTVTSSNYVVDGNQVSITKTVTNTSPIAIATETAYSGTNLTWSIISNVSIIKVNNGGTISWNCNRTKELVNSSDPTCYSGQYNPIIWTKAVVKLNGSANGTNNKGESYTALATNLIRDFNCAPLAPTHPHRHPFVSGTIDYTPGARATRHIDYGSGQAYPAAPCDLLATVTINGQTWSITLP